MLPIIQNLQSLVDQRFGSLENEIKQLRSEKCVDSVKLDDLSSSVKQMEEKLSKFLNFSVHSNTTLQENLGSMKAEVSASRQHISKKMKEQKQVIKTSSHKIQQQITEQLSSTLSQSPAVVSQQSE